MAGDLAVSINTDIDVGQIPGAVMKALEAEAGSINAMLLAKMVAKASGGVTQIRTGRLAGSFRASIRKRDTGFTATVKSTDRILNILEGGGTVKPREIRPTSLVDHIRGGRSLGSATRALHFLGTSGEVFAAVVHQKGFTIPPHSIVNSTFKEEERDIVERLEKTIETVTGKEGTL
jgi:hypothetical protein